MRFISKTKCDIIKIDDFEISKNVIDRYFDLKSPFSKEKKSEFPDAFALLSLEEFAKQAGTKALIVAHDKDWQAFCEEFEHLVHVDSLEGALDLFNNIEVDLMQALIAELDKSSTSALREEISHAIARSVKTRQFNYSGWAPTDFVVDHYDATLDDWKICPFLSRLLRR